MSVSRQSAKGVLLTNGKVLVAGGVSRDSADMYDPFTNSWSPAGFLGAPRVLHTLTALPDGRAILAGGTTGAPALRVAQLFNPETASWSQTADLLQGRVAHAATLLIDGRVLVSGGSGEGNVFLATAEIYSPATGL